MTQHCSPVITIPDRPKKTGIPHTSSMRRLPVHRLCPLRDPSNDGQAAVRVVVVVWPPFGEPDDPRLLRRGGDASGTAD